MDAIVSWQLSSLKNGRGNLVEFWMMPSKFSIELITVGIFNVL